MTALHVLLVPLTVLPEAWLRTHWFAVLAAFVAANTIMYVALSVGHLLPKPYVSDWLPRRGRRTQDRSIYAGTRDTER